MQMSKPTGDLAASVVTQLFSLHLSSFSFSFSFFFLFFFVVFVGFFIQTQKNNKKIQENKRKVIQVLKDYDLAQGHSRLMDVAGVGQPAGRAGQGRRRHARARHLSAAC